jgi:uncharacterized membrane protein YccF (DUF307 family)
MRTVGDILWLLVAGLWLAIGYVIAGIVNCLFIITIPFGIQSFKLASYVLWPFGRAVVVRPGRDVALGCLGNAIWFFFSRLALAPFGKEIVSIDEMRRRGGVAIVAVTPIGS